MAINYNSPLGSVRALIPDVDEDDFILPNGLIETYLRLSGDRVFLATAMALEAIATDEVLTYKITRTDDLSVNGVTGSEQLRLRAKDLRDQDAAAEAEESFAITYPTQGRKCRPEATAWPVW